MSCFLCDSCLLYAHIYPNPPLLPHFHSGHLGHVFPDGPTRGSLDAKELETVPESDPQIGYKVQGSSAGDKESKYSRMPRFCVNGAAMRFEEGGQL